jgi:hypothetical protein
VLRYQKALRFFPSLRWELVSFAMLRFYAKTQNRQARKEESTRQTSEPFQSRLILPSASAPFYFPETFFPHSTLTVVP